MTKTPEGRLSDKMREALALVSDDWEPTPWIAAIYTDRRHNALLKRGLIETRYLPWTGERTARKTEAGKAVFSK